MTAPVMPGAVRQARLRQKQKQKQEVSDRVAALLDGFATRGVRRIKRDGEAYVVIRLEDWEELMGARAGKGA